MKVLSAALFLIYVLSLSACTKSTQGNSSVPVAVTLSYATSESGQLELVNSITGYSYAKMSSGSTTVGIQSGTAVTAIWIPADGDSNVAEYWLDSRVSGSLATGAKSYKFTVAGPTSVKMHLQALSRAVEIVAPLHGILSWSLNGAQGHVVAGDSNANLVVRASDTFSVTWDANGSAYFMSVWDLKGDTKTDRSRKDSATANLVLTEDTQVSAELTLFPLPHHRMQIRSPSYGNINFTNPDLLVPIILPSNQMRYGLLYEIVTDNDPLTTDSMTVVYEDLGTGFGGISYNYIGVTTALTLGAGSSTYNDGSIPITSTWMINLRNDGSDDALDLNFGSPVSSCAAIGQLYVDRCYNGNSYCATLGKSFNGTSCY